MNLESAKQQYPEYTGKTSKNCIDMTNQRFGKLLVLYRYKENTKQNQALWVCQCDCGNIKPIRGASLRNGKATSCGCQTHINASKANINNLIGQKFGMLTVVEDTKKRKNHRVVWKCVCDCGREVERIGDTLIQGDSKSCGYHNLSNGVIEIIKLLQDNNILFEQEKTYDDLLGKNNMPYRYDFYLPEYNRLIEFDGIQHTQQREIFKDKIEDIQFRDMIKNQYALSHNIDLIRIPHWKENNIKLADLLDSKFLVEE